MEDPGIWKEVAKYLWGVLVPVGAYLWNKQDKRLDRIEEKMFTQEEAKERRKNIEDVLEARRQDVIALHSKIDARAEKLDDKIEALQQSMHAGFSDLKDILLKR